MDAVKVGIRELRADLPKFLLETGRPLEVTRHGETVGYYIPIRKRVSDADAEALLEAGRTMDALLAKMELSEAELSDGINQIRKAERSKILLENAAKPAAPTL